MSEMRLPLPLPLSLRRGCALPPSSLGRDRNRALALLGFRCRASLITDSASFQVGRLLGSYGFINVTTTKMGTDPWIETGPFNFKAQDVGEGGVNIRLYEGRVAVQGPLRGTPCVFKVYPGRRAGGIESDMMAANELNTHAFLQSCPGGFDQNLVLLIGGFETSTGEQWLAFRDDGSYSAADYAKASSEKLTSSSSNGNLLTWNYFQREHVIKLKQYFIMKLLRGALSGLAFMHKHEQLHQSLGPSSLIVNTLNEKDGGYLFPRLRDLAFSVDIRYYKLEEGHGLLSQELWRRAAVAGVVSLFDKRAFGLADDIYAAGLLLAYLAFVPFCESGTVDSLSLQRLLETTFQLDISATREYCLADDRLLEAVKFLDLGDRAGWDLLQRMLDPDYRKRPCAEAVLNHRFLNGSIF
ncbi:hypothetical protein MLD38_019808 [Melastoma candidum]|uniref:Uncharacterized protein n=1 Tax=Melastoma candidum TaxID=119954 RepID=A0ACB9QB41_9MYRT|nr:hypothetical protein MLD38_019808 [Melastoma candidum]